MINEELLQFYKDELVSLKEQLMIERESNKDLKKENLLLKQDLETLDRQNNILKDNNDGLSEMFTQYKQYTQDLELQLANLSVDRAEKELLIDTLQQQIRYLKRGQRESIVSDFEQGQKQDSPDNLSVVSVEELSFQHQKSLDSKQDSIIYLKKSFHTPQKNNKPDIQQIIDNIPRSSYTILYEEEMKKIKDTSNKPFEMKIWQEKVINLFDEKYKNQKIINEKLKDLLINSYPEQFRGKIWPFVCCDLNIQLIGNQLQINKGLYERLLQSIPNHPLVTSELLTLVNNDLQRTFSIINDFEDADKLKDDLREILIIFHIYRPDVGYVQGMTYLAFMFLIRMSKQKTLKCFSNLIFKSQLLRTFYQFKSHYLDAYFLTFDYYFKEKLPQLAARFTSLNLPKQSFLVEWYYTIFARAFNLITSSKIWDYFLCEGDSFLIRLTLAIFTILEQDLLKQEYEDILMFIRQKTYQVSSTELFKTLQKIKIEPKNFQAKLQKQLEEL